MSIYTGCLLITHIKSIGGNDTFDLVRVVGGDGTCSKPWQALSLITGSTYLATAMMITKESYLINSTLEEAKQIYLLHTNKLPELLIKA